MAAASQEAWPEAAPWRPRIPRAEPSVERRQASAPAAEGRRKPIQPWRAPHPPVRTVSSASVGVPLPSLFSSSCPAKAGKGDHPKGGGRGVGLDDALSTTVERRVRRPFHRARARSPSPVFTGEEEYVRRCLKIESESSYAAESRAAKAQDLIENPFYNPCRIRRGVGGRG